MSKAELVEKIAEQAKLTKVDAERSVNAFINVVTAALKEGEDVTLVGFGTFTTGERAERQGRNPQTGEAITIAAKKVVKFKPGKALKEEVGGCYRCFDFSFFGKSIMSFCPGGLFLSLILLHYGHESCP